MWLLCDIHWRGASIKPKIFQPGQWVDHFNQWNLSILNCPVLPTYWLLRKKTYTECDFKKNLSYLKIFLIKDAYSCQQRLTELRNRHIINVSKELYGTKHLQRRKIRHLLPSLKNSKIATLTTWKIRLYDSTKHLEKQMFSTQTILTNIPKTVNTFLKDIIAAYTSDNLKLPSYKITGTHALCKYQDHDVMMRKERLRRRQIGGDHGDLKIGS